MAGKNQYHPIIFCTCGTEMKYIYDPKLRKYCYECGIEMTQDYAREILGINYHEEDKNI